MSKRMWVVGGSSGIGLGIAQTAADNGYFVQATDHKVDVRDWDMLADFAEQNGPFDVVVYSTGINYLEWISSIECDMTQDLLDVNVTGFIGLLRVLVERQDAGKILAITSDAAVRPMRTSIAYCASKAALNMAVKVAARELAPAWQVNALAPGIVDGTEMTKYVDRRVPEIRGWADEHASKYEQSQIPLGRRATVEECAQLALAIIESPAYLTGSIITMNGGR